MDFTILIQILAVVLPVVWLISEVVQARRWVLIDTVIANIEAGNKDGLLRELRQLKADFQPT
jgi:hypothetical protein